MNTIKFGKFIANLRNEKHLTQEELAELLYIDKRKISRWECGMSIPDFDMLIRLSEILDISLYELSICEKIEDKNIPRRVLNKFKNIKDFKRYKLKKKIIFIISIFIRLFFIFTAIYTLKFYGSVEIYKIISVDDEYVVKGSYIHAKDYNSYNIHDLYYIDADKKVVLDTDRCEYEIYNKDTRIAHLTNQKQTSSVPYEDITKLADSEIIKLDIKNNNFKLKIICENNSIPSKEYLINIQFIKKFDNRLF